MSTDLRQLAIDYLAREGALDIAGMLERFADNARVWMPGQGWISPERFASLVDSTRDMLVDGICFSHDQVLVDGNRAVVMTDCDSPLTQGGSYVNRLCFVFTFNEAGKITEMREYTDSAPAVAAFHAV